MTAQMVTLGEVVEIKGGGTPSKSKPEYYTGDIPWVTPKDMKVWQITDAIDKITTEAVEKSTTNLVPRNSVLLVNRSGILKHTLPVAIAKRPVAINQDMKALLCSEQVDPDYLAYLIKDAEPTILKWVRATTADNFPIQLLRELEIPLPPLEEQKRIAGILDQAAELCRLRTHTLDKLNTLGQAIFHEMFGSVSDQVQLSELTLKITDGTHQAPEWAETGVPFIFVSNVRGQKISLETQKYVTSDEHERMVKRTNISAGDVIYTCVGSYGNAAVVVEDKPFVFQRHIAHLKPDPERLVPTFLAYGLESPSVKAQADRTATGIAQKTVTLKALKEFMFPRVPVEDQLAFTSRVEGVQHAASVAAAAAEQSQTLFASLQHRAFRGEL